MSRDTEPGSRRYVASTFTGEPETLDIVQALAGTFCVHGVLTEDGQVTLYFDSTREADDAERTISEYLRTLAQNVSYHRSEVEEQNWNEEFERSLTPIRIDETLVIRQSWSDGDEADEGLVITIDPKMSFGTGHHESTRLIARLLHRESLDGKRVLDIGTGTGILAILAVKMGALRVVAIDNNEWAVANASENLVLNGVGDRVELLQAQLEDLEPWEWDCVLANLHTNLIIQLLPTISRGLSPDGCLLTSGVVVDDYDRLLQAAGDVGLDCDIEERENEWIASRFVKQEDLRGGK